MAAICAATLALARAGLLNERQHTSNAKEYLIASGYSGDQFYRQAPVVTDGPFPKSKELLAGYRMIDVESVERAIEIAARGSAAPGPGGAPIRDRIEVREVMGAIER